MTLAHRSPGFDSTRRARVRAVLLQALDLVSSERAAYVEDVCRDDPTIRDEVLMQLEELRLPRDFPKGGVR